MKSAVCSYQHRNPCKQVELWVKHCLIDRNKVKQQS